MFDEIDAALRRSARLSACFIPPRDVVNLFSPDADGNLEDVGRAEARQRGLKWYVSPRLSVLDKPYRTKSGVAATLRYCSNSLSGGEARLANRLHAARKAGGA